MPAGIKYLHWVVHLLLLFDQRGKQVLLGGILTFNRSLIDSIYCYCTVCLHDSVACGQTLSNEREFYQSHMLRLMKLSEGRIDQLIRS